jgi:hypothetical protein
MSDDNDFSHRVVTSTSDLEQAGWAARALTDTGIPAAQVHVFHQQLPGGIAADQAPQHFARLTSPWRWARRAGAYAVPLGVALWALGYHWLWLPGVVAIGLVWGWFARFYLDLFRGELTRDLIAFGVSREDAPFWQTRITDGGVVLVATLTAAQVPDAVEALDAAGFSDRCIYMP